MPNFAYTALNAEGARSAGVVTAETRSAALDRLAEMRLRPVAISERQSVAAPAIGRLRTFGRVSRSAVEAFTRGLANLLAAGVPLSRALQILSRETSSGAARQQWTAVHDDVVGGMPLADALARWPRSFPPVYVAMVRAGEAGGFLDAVLGQIADFQARDQELKGRVKAALVYPCVLAVLATMVLVFLLTFFIPRFSSIFAEFGGKLPVLTRAIVAMSGLVVRYGFVLLIAAAVALAALRRLLSTEAGRRTMEWAMLAAPGVGQVVARFAVVRFCRMLGTLLGAGVPLVAALRVAREAIGNQTLADAVSRAIEEVQRGTPLSRGLGLCPQLFPASVSEMVAVAEESGRLDKELVRLAITYEAELDRRLRMLVSLAEPLLLFVMAGIVGTIVVGMLLPVFMLQDLVH